MSGSDVSRANGIGNDDGLFGYLVLERQMDQLKETRSTENGAEHKTTDW